MTLRGVQVVLDPPVALVDSSDLSLCFFFFLVK